VNINKEHISNRRLSRKSIYSITPFTLLDYPDKTACIIWFAGCNMRCGYCYNPEIVFGKGKMTIIELQEFLQSRIGLLDGVVLSGGECMMYSEITDIIKFIKSMGYKVKIDTNGSNPKKFDYLIQNELIDYVALDFKSPLSKFFLVTKTDFFNDFVQSLQILIHSDVKFEIRTTYHSDLLTISDLQEMADFLVQKGYQGQYFIQQFRNGTDTIGNLKESKRLETWIDHSVDNIEIIFRNNDN
jgi:pyruvate formate lyase activating enzyme